MAVGEIVNTSTEVISDSIVSLGNFALILQALGIIIVLNVVFQIISLIYTRRINKHLKRIETKLSEK